MEVINRDNNKELCFLRDNVFKIDLMGWSLLRLDKGLFVRKTVQG